MSIRVTLSPEQLRNPAILQAFLLLIAEMKEVNLPLPELPETLNHRAASDVHFSPLFHAENTPRFERFAERLPRRSQEFLRQLCSQRCLSVTQAISALQLNDADGQRTLNGLSSAIARKASFHTLPAPFVRCEIDGQNGWFWVGPQMPAPSNEKELNEKTPTDKATSEKTSQKTTDENSPRKAKRIVGRNALNTTPQAAFSPMPSQDTQAPDTQKAPLPTSLLESLDADGQLFLTTLHQRGWMPLYDLLTMFKMPRAMTLGRILEPIQRQLKQLGLEKPFSKETVGHWRIYIWSGVALPEEVPEPTERTPKTTIRKRRQPRPNGHGRRPERMENREPAERPRERPEPRAARSADENGNHRPRASYNSERPKYRGRNGNAGPVRNYNHSNETRRNHEDSAPNSRSNRAYPPTDRAPRNRDSEQFSHNRARNNHISKAPEVTIIQRKTPIEQIPVVRIRRPNEP